MLHVVSGSCRILHSQQGIDSSIAVIILLVYLNPSEDNWQFVSGDG
jgi:hypothetical protein